MSRDSDSTGPVDVTIDANPDVAAGAASNEILAADATRNGYFNISVKNTGVNKIRVALGANEDGTRNWIPLDADEVYLFEAVNATNKALVGQEDVAITPSTAKATLDKTGAV